MRITSLTNVSNPSVNRQRVLFSGMAEQRSFLFQYAVRRVHVF